MRCLSKRARQDSNLRLPPPEGSALSTELRARAGQSRGSHPWRPVLIAVISDTHLPRGARRLPTRAWSACARADLILHAGDFMTAAALGSSRRSGRRSLAVHGNVDDAELRRRLPEERVVEAGGARIAMVHDAGPRQGRLERLRAPLPRRRRASSSATRTCRCTRRSDGFQIFNPGSPTERRRAPAAHHGRSARVERRPGRVSSSSTSAASRYARHGPRRPLRRHRRLGAHRAPRPARHARAPRRRAAAVRLRRGHPAPAPALGRAGRARGGLHHPLPRRPRARPARDAQDLRPARARAPADRLRPARAASALFAGASRR